MNHNLSIAFVFNFETSHYQDGRVVKALDLSSNGRVVRVGSNPTPGKDAHFNSHVVKSRYSRRVTNGILHS